jgi:leucyl/phenylalanyl-tRNA--protein transferase
MTTITPELLLRAYAAGIFPMGENRDDPTLYWIDPERRGVIPLAGFHVPRRLARTIRGSDDWAIVDRSFDTVVRACAAPARGRNTTWINDEILRLYGELHRRGHAHSVEIWRNERLIGGLYGVVLGAAFFGESMFSLERDASKVALVHLVARLRAGGFRLLDTQFVTEHLSRFGTIELARVDYHRLLAQAIDQSADFLALPPYCRVADALQSITQTS